MHSYQEPLYQGTNITGKKAVKDAKMQLNDALIEPYRAEKGSLTTFWKVIERYLR